MSIQEQCKALKCPNYAEFSFEGSDGRNYKMETHTNYWVRLGPGTKGCMTIYDDDEQNCYFYSISVNEHFRGRGIGNILLQALEQLAKAYGCKTAYLKVLKGSWMQEWYERHGYVLHEGQKKYVWLKKNLI